MSKKLPIADGGIHGPPKKTMNSKNNFHLYACKFLALNCLSGILLRGPSGHYCVQDVTKLH